MSADRWDSSRNKDPQTAFDKARSQVPMALHEEQDRRRDIEREGSAFVSDAVDSAKQMPGLLSDKNVMRGAGAIVPEAGGAVGEGGYTRMPRARSTDRRLVSVSARGSDAAPTSMEASASTQGGRLKITDAGGIAGGTKAVDERFGLFLKTPDDQRGIFGSMVMAAKVMKLEVNANRWIHGIDSIHVNATLSTVVDVPYKQRDGTKSVCRV